MGFLGKNTFDAIAVSEAAEASINAGATLAHKLMPDKGELISLERAFEDNKNEMTGYEEPTAQYAMGQTSKASLKFSKLKPHELLWMAAYTLGDVTASTAGTGESYVIRRKSTPMDNNRDLPTFFAAIRRGSGLYEAFYGLSISKFGLQIKTGDKPAFITGDCEIVGTGKYENNFTSETVSALPTVTELTLDANGVYGSTADERLESVHAVIATLSTGERKYATVTAVSDAEPAVLTIEAVGTGVANVPFEIIYRPEEPVTGWLPDFHALTPNQELPLRITQVTVKWDATWNGTSLIGGQEPGCALNSIDYSLSNNAKAMFCIGGGGNDYAGRQERGEWAHSLKLDRRFNNYIPTHFVNSARTMAIHVKAEQSVEYDTGHKAYFDIVFPKVGVKTYTRGADGMNITESLDYVVMEDTTYGSIIINGKTDVLGASLAQ